MSEFSLRLIKADDDYDNFSFKLQKKLSLVLDELESFLKKENHQNLIPDMMGPFLEGPPHSKCLENAKNASGRKCTNIKFNGNWC